jgi:hypothetical protein
VLSNETAIPALNLATFGRWTLRDKAAPAELFRRWGSALWISDWQKRVGSTGWPVLKAAGDQEYSVIRQFAVDSGLWVYSQQVCDSKVMSNGKMKWLLV